MEVGTQVSVMILNLMPRRRLLQLLVHLPGPLPVRRFAEVLTLIRQETVLMAATPGTAERVELLAALRQDVLERTRRQNPLLL